MHFFHILLESTYICRLNFCLVFIFRSRQAGIVSSFLLSAVSLTRVNNFSAVSLTPAINVQTFWLFLTGINDTGEQFFAGVIDSCDDRGLFFLKNCEPLGKNNDAAARRQQYLRPTGLDGAADDVIGTTMKRRIHRHPTQPDQRPLRPPRLLQTKTGISPSAEVGHSLRQFHSNCHEKTCPQTQHTP